MNYLSVENLTKSFGERVLFEDISFGIDQGQKVAFVARNGTGKTTLLRLLSGKDTPDSGLVTYRKEIKVGVLDQETSFDSNLTVMETVFHSGGEALQAIKNYEMALAKPDDHEAYQAAFERMELLNAWDYETRIKQILGKLRIDRLDQPVSTLSGGQRRRVALAQVLIDAPDFLILDEPTNHLDLEMIEWLEQFLNKDEQTVFMVTHDRFFLDRVCDVIIELDDQELHRYKGNYSYFLEKREERYQIQSAEISKARSLMKTELEWVRRQPKARGTKAKYRMDSFQELKKKASQRIEERELKIGLNTSRMGSKIVEFHKVKKGYDGIRILDQFDYVFRRTERVGLIGRNGSGKTTFLDMMTGSLEPDGGKVVIGETVVFGYYTQDGMNISDDKRVIEVIRDIAEYLPLTKGQKLTAAQLLERFLFPRDMHFNYVRKLSGGEKKRLYLLTILMQNPNFLILDEPTNDLDIMTLGVLEDFLQEFPGVLVIVSHDRFFMDKLVDHLFVLDGKGGLKDFPGNYSQYRIWADAQKKVERAEVKKQEAKTVREKPAAKKTKLTYKEKLEFEQLEKDIEVLEARKVVLTEIMNSGTADHEALMKAGEEMGTLITDLETKEMRWLELSEYV